MSAPAQWRDAAVYLHGSPKSPVVPLSARVIVWIYRELNLRARLSDAGNIDRDIYEQLHAIRLAAEAFLAATRGTFHDSASELDDWATVIEPSFFINTSAVAEALRITQSGVTYLARAGGSGAVVSAIAGCFTRPT